MRHLSPRRINLNGRDIKSVEIREVDFDTKVYSDEELHSISRLISQEIGYRNNAKRDLEALDLKAKYEGNWVIDRGNLYYILEITDTYSFKYLYLCRDTHDLLDDKLPNFGVGIERGHGDFWYNFSEDMRILDSDEAGAMITKFKEDLNKLIEEECN